MSFIMRIKTSKVRKLIKGIIGEAYVHVFRKTGESNKLMPSFEQAPNNLSKKFLEQYMLKSYMEHERRLSKEQPGKALNELQADSFKFARADVLQYIYSILSTGQLKSDAPGHELPGDQLVDRTQRSQLVFTTNDYRDDYEFADTAEHPYNPDPRLLPNQSFEKVVKTSQEDLLSITKGAATFDPSPNAKAIDDYVNSIVEPMHDLPNEVDQHSVESTEDIYDDKMLGKTWRLDK